MLQPNFQSDVKRNTPLNKTKSRQPKLRVEYSAGFRKLDLKKDKQDQTERTSVSKYKRDQNQIIKYVDQIGVQNLTHLYSETIQDPTKLLYQKYRQQQQQSVVRLYKNLYPTRSRAQQTVNSQQSKQNKRYASQLWNLDKKYQKQPPQYIVKKQLQKLYKKCHVELNGIIKRKKIQNTFAFEEIFSCFLLSQYENIIKVLSKQIVNVDYQMQMFYLWKSFLSTANFKFLLKKHQNKVILKQNIERIRNLSKFFYSLIRVPKQNQNQKNQGRSLKLQQLKKWIPLQFHIPIQEIKQKFQIDKDYTNPYCIEYKNNNKASINNDSQYQQQQQINNYKFKAAPVPKTTYQQPKQIINRPEPKTTVPQPFKIKEQKKQPMTAQQYYHWQRQFKAQPIPKTNQKPFKPELLSEKEKKARAFINLQKAKYPKTMQNLQNYPNQYEKKIEQLTKKHVKSNYQQYHPHQVPNFDRLHAQQIVNFQNIREKNKKQIKIEPFHLSTGKQRFRIQDNNFTRSPKIHPYSPPKPPSKPSKSTKKFDAYVNYRNQHETKRAQKQQKQKKQNQKKQQIKKPYRQIIKQRMVQQLQSHPMKKNTYDASFPPKIKVDKQKIYRQRPLLMQSTLPPQQPHLQWDPIF